MKILTVVGARPQFVKAAVLSRCFRETQANIQEEIIHTGQHYDPGMSDVFFEEMDIPKPAVNLQVGSKSHGEMTAEMLKGIESELKKRKPDLVLVYGDTNSTLAGALAASKLHVPIAHVEAGERSYNKKMPEEINRIMTDHVSSLLFCCSNKSKQRLSEEGIKENTFVVGDLMYDAFLNYLPKAKFPHGLINSSKPFALATLHRAENTDDGERLKFIFDTFAALPEDIVLPLHPRTLQKIKQYNIRLGSNVQLLQPLSYFEMLGLLKVCDYVLSDSGGLQKEAYYARKKCIVLRKETEWTELVDEGVNKISGSTTEELLENCQWAKEINEMPKNLYGDGKAGHHILNHLKNFEVQSISEYA